MSFEIDQYELDYDEHPPTPTNASRVSPREYGPVLPSHLLEESAPEDPIEVRTSRTIGPFMPPDMRPSTSTSDSARERREDDSSTLPSLNGIDLPGTSARHNGMELPEDNDFLNVNDGGSSDRSRDNHDLAMFPTPSPPTISNCSTDANARVFGPMMPDEGASSRQRATSRTADHSDEDENVRIIGPTIPSFLVEPSSSVAGTSREAAECSNVNNGGARIYGPVMPPSPASIVYGPAVPSSLASSAQPGNDHNGNDDANNNDDDDDIVGPVMPSSNVDEHDDEYYYRLMQLQEKQMESNAPRREEWMTELPQTLRQSYGLSAKSAFSSSSAIPLAAADKARNEWTKTPNSAESSTSSGSRRVAPSELMDPQPQTSKSVGISNSGSGESAPQPSLLDIHQRKRKGACDQGPVVKVGERVPFNRDVDMEIHGLSKMTAEEAKNRAGNLVSRFESSSSNRFL